LSFDRKVRRRKAYTHTHTHTHTHTGDILAGYVVL